MENQYLKNHYDKWYSDNYAVKDLDNMDKRSIKFFNLILDCLDKNNKITKGKKLLDVACGNGVFLGKCAQSDLEVFGLDISSEAIEIAKKFIKEDNLTIGDAEKMPYPDEKFDYVACLGSLEHFPHPDKGIREMSRVLKKDGLAIIFVPNLMFLGHIYMAYKYGVMPSEGGQSFSEVFYTYNGWKELLEGNDLEVINCQPYNRIFATKKVSKFIIFLWEKLIRFFVPLHLSYAFAFICKKKQY